MKNKQCIKRVLTGIVIMALAAFTFMASARTAKAADVLNKDGSKIYAKSAPTLSAHQFAFPISEGKMSIWTAEVKDPSVLGFVSDSFVAYPVNPEALNGSDGLGVRYFVFAGLKEGDTFITLNETGISDKSVSSSLSFVVHVNKNLDPSWELSTVASKNGIDYRPALTVSGTKFTVLGKTYDLTEQNSQVTKIISAEYVDSKTFIISAQTSDNSEYSTAFDTSIQNYTDWQKNSKAR